MTDRVQKFLADIVRLSPSLGDAHQETIQYWVPEDPPVTVAYAEVGQKLVDVFDALDLETRTSIFRLVEQGMQSDDELLGVAVATGLIEGIVGRASRLGTWERIRKELGLFPDHMPMLGAETRAGRHRRSRKSERFSAKL